MSGVCLCVCCSLDHWRWWQRQGRGDRSGKSNGGSRLVQQRHQHMVVKVLEEVMGEFPPETTSKGHCG